jgi:hypothetical protein
MAWTRMFTGWLPVSEWNLNECVKVEEGRLQEDWKRNGGFERTGPLFIPSCGVLKALHDNCLPGRRSNIGRYHVIALSVYGASEIAIMDFYCQ